jgi:hypothetical protein
MRSIGLNLLLVGFSLGVAQGTAHANACYFVYDRNDNVIYRDPQPPVDMSDRGAASRDAMRQRGEYLMFYDTDRCAPLAFLTGPGTPGTLSVDQIVGGYPTMVRSDGTAPPISSSTTGRAAPANAGK